MATATEMSTRLWTRMASAVKLALHSGTRTSAMAHALMSRSLSDTFSAGTAVSPAAVLLPSPLDASSPLMCSRSFTRAPASTSIDR